MSWIMVKNICYSSRGPRFDSEHPHDSLQSSVTQFHGICFPLLESSVSGTCLLHRYTHIQTTHTFTHTNNFFKLLKKITFFQ